MLKDRVIIGGSGFKVLKESGSTARRIYYGLFDLAQNPDEQIAMKEFRYWDGAETYEVRLERDGDTCVRVIEKEGERVKEQYEFFYSHSGAKKELSFSIEKAKKKYGTNAWLLTIEWIACRSEPISSRHIYLENQSGERFYFLRDTIEAMNPDGSRLMDQYITRLPEDQNINEYHLAADELVRQKYDIL